MLHPEGRDPIGAAVFARRALPISPERPVLDVDGDAGHFVAQLYAIEALITFPDGREARFETQAMGWRAVWPAL